MRNFITSLVLAGLAIPLSGATISGTNSLRLTFNQVANVTIVDTNDVTVDIDQASTGVVFPFALAVMATSDDSPVPFLFASNVFDATAGPGGQATFALEANAALIILRNSGRVDAVVPIDFLLIMNGLAGGPGAAQFAMRSIMETALDSSNPWTTVYEASLNADSPGPLTAVDYCSTSLCSGQFNLLVPAGSVLQVRSSATTTGLVSHAEVPEPSSLLLAGMGLGALLLFRCRR